MNSIHSFIGLLFFFAAGGVSHGSTLDDCSSILVMPTNENGTQGSFPILNATKHQQNCMNLDRYRSCVNERATEASPTEMLQHAVAINTYTIICNASMDMYANALTQARQCLNNLTDEYDCRFLKGIFDCIVEKIKIKPFVVKMTQTLFEIVCVAKSVLSNAPSIISPSTLSVLPWILFLWFGIR